MIHDQVDNDFNQSNGKFADNILKKESWATFIDDCINAIEMYKEKNLIKKSNQEHFIV